MNHGLNEARSFFEAVKAAPAQTSSKKNLLALVCPQAPLLFPLAALAKSKNFGLGAQNCSTEKSGAFTGELAVSLIAETGAQYTLIGHSERRALFGESNAMLSKKLQLAQAAGLTPIFCIGETLAEREAGTTNAVVEAQLKEGLVGLDKSKPWILAYEPVWAIGTGKVATPAQAQEVHAFIRAKLGAWGLATGLHSSFNRVPILYGGSVKPDHASELGQQPDLDGFLVGGASLDAKSFSALIDLAP
jgi:triosephosphate isomerase